uniref:TIL domain-containing protein n=1 Tax=Panagrolaimus superbus TaxID=310955 RepID=A0A914YKK0_9BILA
MSKCVKMNVTSSLIFVVVFLIQYSIAQQYNCGSCPQGTSCDTNTGVCRQFRPPAGGGSISRCRFANCPYGQQCDENTGQCVVFRDPGSTNRCMSVQCPQGTSCDSNTGVCRQFRPPAGGSRCTFSSCPYGQQCDANSGLCRVFRDPTSSNRCLYVQCPQGYQCDSNAGVCRNFRDPIVKTCNNVLCPQGTSCDSNTGVCRQFRPPAIFRRLVTDRCSTVQCPNGFTCDQIDGICRNNRVTTTEPTNYEIFEAEQISHPQAPSIAWRRPAQDYCPPNSEYVTCGTRCPYTCTELHPRCSTNEHNCVGACHCLDGFVQVSSANVTCIPAKECPEISDKLCEGLKCPAEMICIDGYCNPVNCPPILKPNLERGCQYELVRDTRNCVVLKSSCEE